MRRILAASTVALVAICVAATVASARPASTGCTKVALPKLAARSAPKPKTALSPKKTYYVTFQTNCGSFTVRLAVKTSPHTSASFASLVKRGFFDKTIFHRIVPGFIIQGGDPTGTGTGGPGYETRDTPPKTLRYTHGVVAMAKTQTEANGTSGSQFFVVTVPNAQLPPQYALLGIVTKGLTVVDRIGKLGNGSEQPTQVVEITHAFVTVK
ncbi:MAG TPA: peptidylprolyl isomerase [Gaiellaceae bacterium]|jgi:cyclophilin family peptidyl-prolyl cis-trans isomerase